MSPVPPRPASPLVTRVPSAVAEATPSFTDLAHGDPPGQEAGRDGMDPRVSPRLQENRDHIDSLLGTDISFDVIVKDLRVAGREAFLVVLDGFVQDDVLLLTLSSLKEAELGGDGLQAILELIPHPEVQIEDRWRELIKTLMSGPALVFIDGIAESLILDTRTYPSREPHEPDLEKVMRGPRDGFTETLVFNTALIRRRLRDPGLRVELQQVGRRSSTDVALLYINDIADMSVVDEIRGRIESIDTDGLLMAEKSLEEYMLPNRQWWNPFPRVRYTERPDTAAVHLMEGGIVLSTDTSPVHMLLPATIFHHLQHAEEFHSDVLVGTFVRGTRFIALFLAWLGPPLWVAIALSQNIMPPAVGIIGPRDPAVVPLFLQFIFGEIGVELLRLGLIHTPSALATSLGIIGAILLGEMAVRVGLFNAEVILYVTLAALGSFAIPSQELRMAVRLWRVVLLLGAGLGRLIGLGVLLSVNLLVLALTRSFGVSYLWPLIPFDGRALLGVLVRKPIPTDSCRPRAYNPRDPDRH